MNGRIAVLLRLASLFVLDATPILLCRLLRLVCAVFVVGAPLQIVRQILLADVVVGVIVRITVVLVLIGGTQKIGQILPHSAVAVPLGSVICQICTVGFWGGRKQNSGVDELLPAQ